MSNLKIAGFFSIKERSSRFENKNFTNLGGKPLYFWAADLLSKIENVTTRSILANENLALDLPTNVSKLSKPSRLDADDAGANEIIQYVSKVVAADWYLFVHATAPFLSPGTITQMLSKVLDGGYDSATTVKAEQTFAYFRGEPINFSQGKISRTQDLEPVLIETNGAYIFSRSLAQQGLRIGKRPYFHEISWPESIDIDHVSDYQEAILALPAARSSQSH